jgi:O-antigen/teichoic acid export membrane protein
MPDLSLPSFEKKTPQPDRISKNSLWIFIGQFGSAILSFLTVFLLTRYLGPEKFGFYSTALSLALLLHPISDLGFDTHLTRAISADTSRLQRELSHTLSIKSILAIAVLGLMVVSAAILNYDSFLIEYVAILGLALVISSVAQSFMAAIRAIRKMRYESLSLLAGRAVTALAICILILLRADLQVIVLAYLSGAVILLTAGYYFLKNETGGLGLFFDLSGWRERARAAFPFGVTAILAGIYFKIDTVILSKMHDAAAVGYYNSAQNFINGSLMLASPLVIAIFPVMAAVYQERREEAADIFRRGLVFILLLGLPLGVGAVLMADSVIKLAYGARFASAAPILTLMAVKIPIVFATLFIGNVLGAIGYQKKVAVVAGVNVVFNVAMNLALIPRYGAMAAAGVTVGTELLGLVQYVFVTRGKLDLAILSQSIKIVFCCIAATAGFLIFLGTVGPWPAAIIFALIYVSLAFLFRLVSITMIRELVFWRNVT